MQDSSSMTSAQINLVPLPLKFSQVPVGGRNWVSSSKYFKGLSTKVYRLFHSYLRLIYFIVGHSNTLMYLCGVWSQTEPVNHNRALVFALSSSTTTLMLYHYGNLRDIHFIFSRHQSTLLFLTAGSSRCHKVCQLMASCRDPASPSSPKYLWCNSLHLERLDSSKFNSDP